MDWTSAASAGAPAPSAGIGSAGAAESASDLAPSAGAGAGAGGKLIPNSVRVLRVASVIVACSSGVMAGILILFS